MNKEYLKKNKNFSKNLGNLGMSHREYIIKGQNPHQFFLGEENVNMNDGSLIVNQFKKKVRDSLHNLRIDIYRVDVKYREKTLLSKNEFLLDDEFYDSYTFLENTVVVMDFKMTVKNDLLYEVLNSMEQQQRDVVYLSLCKDMSDKKIGEKLRLSCSSVQRIKQSMSKNFLKYFFEGEGFLHL